MTQDGEVFALGASKSLILESNPEVAVRRSNQFFLIGMEESQCDNVKISNYRNYSKKYNFFFSSGPPWTIDREVFAFDKDRFDAQAGEVFAVVMAEFC